MRGIDFSIHGGAVPPRGLLCTGAGVAELLRVAMDHRLFEESRNVMGVL